MRARIVRSALALALVAGGAAVLHHAESAPRLVPVADARSAADESVAFAIAEQYGHPVTIDSATTETELVQAEPDHSKVLTENTEPVRVKRNGAWVPVDTTLQPVAGMVQPTSAAVPVQFSAGGTGALARVQAPSGQWLAESWPGGALPAPSVHGSTATYADVYPGVDLVLTATAVGMSEVLVIADATAAANPALATLTFGVDAGGLRTARQPGGSAVARAADGTAELTAAAATWWDSSSPGASADGPGGRGVRQPVSETVSDSQVQVDASVAAHTGRVRYPVYVDPVWTGGELGWAMVDSAYPDQAYWKDAGSAGGNQHVGYIDGGNSDDGRSHIARSYWQMSTSQLGGTHITSAMFNTTEVYSFSCSARPVSLYTAGAVNSSTTWNTQPGLSALSDTQNVALGYSSSCPSGGVGFDATAAVQRAADAGSAVINLALIASSTDSYGWKKFSGSAALRVGYYSIPTVPISRHLTPCWAVCGLGAVTGSTTPTLDAHSTIARDPNTNAYESTLRYVWEVCTRQADGSPGGCRNYLRTALATAGQQVSVQMLSTEPATDGNWQWRALACRTDIGDACSDWSGWYPFTVDTTPPPAPKLSSTAFDLTGQERRGREYVPGQLAVAGGNAGDDYAFSFSATPGATRIGGKDCTAQDKLDVVLQCVGTGDAGTFTVQPQLPGGNSVNVYAYDRAGNLSAPGCLAAQPTLCGQDIRYDVNFAIANHPEHAWVITQANADASSATLLDAAPGTAQSATLNSSGTPVYLPSGPMPSDPVISFDGSEYLNSTAGALTNDEGHSFTAAIWVRPGGVGTQMTALSQGGKDSVFQLLQTADGHFQFCMAGTTWVCTPERDGLQATHNSHMVGAGLDWALLVAVWNAPARTMLLYDSDANDATHYATVSRPAGTSSTDPVVVGSAVFGGKVANGWSGAIGDVLLYQAVLDPSQINALHLAPQNLG